MNAFFKKMKNGRVTHGLKKQISARNHGAADEIRGILR